MAEQEWTNRDSRNAHLIGLLQLLSLVTQQIGTRAANGMTHEAQAAALAKDTELLLSKTMEFFPGGAPVLNQAIGGMALDLGFELQVEKMHSAGKQ